MIRAAGLVLVALATVAAAGQEAQKPADQALSDKARQEEVARLAPAKAKLLEVRVGDEEPVNADLVKQPLLRWTNPTVGSVHGEVFLWTVADRPAAIASIFRWYHPFKDATVEITSLSSSPVVAREDGAVVWDSQLPGVTLQPLDGPALAMNKVSRLTQMRAFIRRFSAQLTDKRSGEPVVRDLRLLNQPIHRYESGEHGIIDGAIFAFAEVTDPEVIVLVEAFKKGESHAWRYALARMNNHELAVRLDDRVVQTWEPIPKPWANRRASYTLFSFDPQSVLGGSP